MGALRSVRTGNLNLAHQPGRGLKYVLTLGGAEGGRQHLKLSLGGVAHVCRPCFGGRPRRSRGPDCILRVLLTDAGELPESFHLQWTRASCPLSAGRQEWVLPALRDSTGRVSSRAFLTKATLTLASGFSHYDPMVADAITGPVEEIPIDRRRSGLRRGETGGLFVKIGVGVLRKADDSPTNSCTPIH